MSPNDPPYASISDDEILQTGKRFGYGTWLQPIINANDQSSSDTVAQSQLSHTPAPTRRGRGRPRVTKLGNESAIEVCHRLPSECATTNGHVETSCPSTRGTTRIPKTQRHGHSLRKTARGRASPSLLRSVIECRSTAACILKGRCHASR